MIIHYFNSKVKFFLIISAFIKVWKMLDFASQWRNLVFCHMYQIFKVISLHFYEISLMFFKYINLWMGWGGRREGGSGWGTHVNPWLIHVNVWQKPLQYCKVISLQLIKINGKKYKNKTNNHKVAKKSI